MESKLKGANDVMRKYSDFKKFDIVEDYSDHYFSKPNSENLQDNRAKKIQQEWRILEKNLPDMIFVRVYESRMDLLRAVIVGAEGTPYHDALFFFDVFFPTKYPDVPPSVHYHSGGLHLNPNLYATGHVCLSLLNTWIGTTNERWKPGVSTMLQVLVSIQGLILNAKPFYNEPAVGLLRLLSIGETLSMRYNEHTLILSLKTMAYTMKKPPKHFEDLVIGHFREHAHDILTRCEAYYTKGIGVECSFDGDKKKCSQQFKNNVEHYMKTLVGAFIHIGAEDVDRYLTPTRILTLKSDQREKETKTLIQMIREFFSL